MTATAYQAFARRFPEFIATIRELRGGNERALADLRGLGRREQRSAVRQQLHHRRFAMLYAYRGVLKAGRIGAATPQSIAEIAASLDPFAPCHERVDQRWIRTSERQRAVQAFGPRKRAHQLFVADLIRALHPPRAGQYLLRGGIPAALAAVEAAYARGMTHAVELDVTAFYGSIPFTILADALRPLPEAVVRHVVFDETIRVQAQAIPSTITRRAMVPPPLDGTQGIPLGAASSPVAGEVIVGQLLAASGIDFDLDIITYADNLLVLGRSEAEATVRAERLTEVAAGPALGSLRLREKGRGHLLPAGMSAGGDFSTGVTFVGQFGRVDPEGKFSWEPCPERRERVMIAESDDCPTLDQIETAMRRVAAYHRAYPDWPERQEHEARERALLSSARFMRKATPEHLHVAARDIALAYLLNWPTVEVLELVPDYGDSYGVRRARLLTETDLLLERMAARSEAAQHAA